MFKRTLDRCKRVRQCPRCGGGEQLWGGGVGRAGGDLHIMLKMLPHEALLCPAAICVLWSTCCSSRPGAAAATWFRTDNGVVKKATGSLKIVHDPFSKNVRLFNE